MRSPGVIVSFFLSSNSCHNICSNYRVVFEAFFPGVLSGPGERGRFSLAPAIRVGLPMVCCRIRFLEEPAGVGKGREATASVSLTTPPCSRALTLGEGVFLQG